MPLPRRITSAFLMAAGAVVVAACATPAVGHLPSTPSSVPASSSILLGGVSCASASYCMAVGAAAVPRARVLPVAEAWNGHRWTGQLVPGPTVTGAVGSRLGAVSCSGPSRCVAVGNTVTATGDVAFADSWDGTRWRLLPLNYPAGSTDLFGVSCRVSICLLTGVDLTGGQNLPLAFELHGTAHRRLTPAIPQGQDGAYLGGVWCGTPSACMTVGSYDPTQGKFGANLAEQWDGSRWRVLKIARPASTRNGPGLVSVACPTIALCLAVGSYSDVSRPGRQFGIREIWQHGQWRMLHPSGPEPQTFFPAAVACQSSSSCIVVGTSGSSLASRLPGAEQWTGSSLRYLPIPHPRAGSMAAISCTSSLMCLAIGNDATAFGELWKGSSWQLLSIP